MNSKQRAELQRKLSLTAVPRPPDGLAERIKADIPKYLTADVERKRLSRTMAFNFRVAASFIILISAVLVAVHLFNDDGVQRTMMSRAAAPNTMPQVAAKTAVPTEEVHVDITQEPAAATAAPAVQSADANNAVAFETARAEPERATQAPTYSLADRAESGASGEAIGGVAGGLVGTANATPTKPAARDAATMVAEAAPLPLPPPPAAPVPPPMPMSAPMSAPTSAPAVSPPPELAVPAPEAPRATAPVQTRSTSLVREAYGDNLALGPRSNIFGISVDPSVFQRVRTAIESGSRPAASAVNVEALVNYFAGAPTKPVRRGVRLEAEASPAPVAKDGVRGLLRFTIDTAAAHVAPGASVPPIAKDARLELDIDRDVVESSRRIGDDDALSTESTLLQNVSVTGLYEIALRPRLKPTQRVATVRLRFVSTADGKPHMIERTLYVSDFTRSWAAASRRHRLASLGALWGETLKGTAGSIDVARRAEELATQNPKDERARELSQAATATAKLSM
ncbi:MAG TPA: von Willebrand factor type A domain-containing protein [Thermoanaerobaculia bacterium]|jgi:hypothetical protein